MDRIRRFRYRTQYFTGSGVIGSKAFVSATPEVFEDRLYASRENIPMTAKEKSFIEIENMFQLILKSWHLSPSAILPTSKR